MIRMRSYQLFERNCEKFRLLSFESNRSSLTRSTSCSGIELSQLLSQTQMKGEFGRETLKHRTAHVDIPLSSHLGHIAIEL